MGGQFRQPEKWKGQERELKGGTHHWMVTCLPSAGVAYGGQIARQVDLISLSTHLHKKKKNKQNSYLIV